MMVWLAAILLLGDDLKGDPGAQALLRETAKACRSIESYQDQGRFVIESRTGGRDQSATWPLSIQKSGPNRLAINAGDVKLFADGQTMITLVGPSKKVMTGPCPAAFTSSRLTEGPLGAMLLGGPYRAAASVLLALMFDDNAMARLAPEIREIQPGPDARLDDRACKTLRIRRQSGPDLILAIDAETHLPRAIEIDATPASFADKVPGNTEPRSVRIGWISGPITTEPPNPTVFQTTPPAGYQQVEAVQVPPEKQAEADRKP